MSKVDQLREINALTRANDTWRGQTINLIASENVISPACHSLLDSDFHHRYAEGHPGHRWYEGTKYIDEIESRTRALVGEIFNADRVDVRLPSGTMANEAAFSALMPDRGTALAHGVGGGGHISHAHMGALGKRADKIGELPRLPDGYQLDAAAASALIRAEKPRLIVLGRSLFLFPEDVSGVREACDEVGATILYDGSHVLGLIAGGQFQDPLTEGADLMTASTHKTYYGPQRGIVVARGKDKDWWKPIDRAVFPGVTSNHHLFSLPAMYAASLEVQEFGAEYAKAVIGNAQAFAAALHKRGFAVAAPDLGYTKSHQVAIDMSAHGGGRDVARKLADHGIIANKNLLPGDPGNSVVNPGGIRTGVQEMTRFGMGEAEMDQIAGLFHDCIVKDKDVTGECKRLREAFPEIKFGFAAGQLS